MSDGPEFRWVPSDEERYQSLHLPHKESLRNWIHRAPTPALRELYHMLFARGGLPELGDSLRSYLQARTYLPESRLAETMPCPCCPYSGTPSRPAGCPISTPPDSDG